MKYMIVFEYPHKPADTYDTALAFKVFDSMPQLPEMKFQGYYGRIDGHGGYVLVETDVPSCLLKIALRFQPFFEYYIYPVLEIQEFADISRTVNREILEMKEESEEEEKKRKRNPT
jgi:hypothetical protein